VVLVVDDEPAQRTVLAGFLRKRGMDVVVAAGVDEAVQIASSRTIDLVLTDLNMPGKDGLVLVESSRASIGGAGHHDDGIRHGRERRRCHEAGSVRLSPPSPSTSMNSTCW
jgi:CheY-like chemotaxis protein